MSRKTKYWLFLFVLVGGVLLVDQMTKRLVVEQLRVGETYKPIPALSPFFQITRSQNTGAAFGFLPQVGDLFLIIAVVVVLSMLYYYPRIKEPGWVSRFCIGLICGGAMGNALDRLQYGHVVDFIHYQIPGLISNVSNIADHAIVLGVILLFIENWRSERERARSQDEAETAARTDQPDTT